jgi:hypothetical protein
MTKRRGYVSYLLRLWQTGHEEKVGWRASLEDPLTGERQSFASLEKLVDFLARLCDQELACYNSDTSITINREEK